MTVYLEHPWALVAIAALPLAVVALAMRRRRRVVVPSTLIHGLILRDAMPTPKRIPWVMLVFEVLGLVVLLLALAEPVAVRSARQPSTVVHDNSMSGGATGTPSVNSRYSVPDAAGRRADVPGDVVSAVVDASMTSDSVVVLSAKEAPAGLPERIEWRRLKPPEQRQGIVRMWAEGNILGVGIARFAEGPLEAVLYEGGRERGRLAVGSGRYVTAEFVVPEPFAAVEEERVFEVVLEPGDEFAVDDTARAVKRTPYRYRFSGKRDAAIAAALRAMGWSEAENARFVVGDAGVDEGIEIATGGEDKVAGRATLPAGLADSFVLRIPAVLEAEPVSIGNGIIALLSVEGKTVAAVDPSRRKIALGFAPSASSWRDNDSWPVFLGLAIERAGYPLSGLSWHVTGDTTPVDIDGPASFSAGQRVATAGVYRDKTGRYEVYNALWPNESAAAAGQGPPVVFPAISRKPQGGAEDRTTLSGAAAALAFCLFCAGGLLWARQMRSEG